MDTCNAIPVQHREWCLSNVGEGCNCYLGQRKLTAEQALYSLRRLYNSLKSEFDQVKKPSWTENCMAELNQEIKALKGQLAYQKDKNHSQAEEIQRLKKDVLAFQDPRWRERRDQTRSREMMQNFQSLCYDQAFKSGFHEDADSVPLAYYAATKLMLIVSEAAEAMEELRKPDETGHVSFDNLGEELADIVIRVFDLAGYLKIDLASSIEYKMEKNANRPHKHGGKVI